MRMFTASITLVLGLFGSIESKPDGENEIPPLISFNKGRIGVNFLGFRAAAGLGGILTGNPADGGLYAEAGTPFGQFAHAGLGGQVDGQGRSAGGLFAGATAGNGVSAKAGLGGSAGQDGSYGTSYAGASAGGLTKTKIRNIGSPVVPAGGIIEFNKGINGPSDFPKNIQVISNKKTNYKEKVVEKKVDIAPEMDIDVRIGDAIPLPPPEPPIIIEKTKIKGRRRPHLKRKQILVTRGGYDGLEVLPGPPIAPIPGPEDVGIAHGPGTLYGTKTVLVRKTVSPEFINDIFNVPISTLTAVSQLVGGLAKNIEGGITINKTLSVNADAHKKA